MKRILKVVSVAGLVLCYSSSSAQCKEEPTKVGTTRSVMMSETESVWAWITYNVADGSFELNLKAQFPDQLTIDEGTPVQVMFDDKSTIELKVRDTNLGEKSSGSMFGNEGSSLYANTLVLHVRPVDAVRFRYKKLSEISVKGETFIAHGRHQIVISDWIECEQKSHGR